MKKVLLIAVAGMFVLTSCKKDWTCECKYNTTVTSSGSELGLKSTSNTLQYPITDQTKSSATTTCDAMKNNVSQSNVSTEYYSFSAGCELK